MKPEQDSYPVFEANQVLTSRHLNDGFNYLDQQERRTRARLIGMGIACGLEVNPGQRPNAADNADDGRLRVSLRVRRCGCHFSRGGLHSGS